MRHGFLLATTLLASTALGHVVPAKSSRALFGAWDKLKRPLQGEPDPIGTYTAGCLGGGQALPLDGPGYSVMRPSRLRYFGHSSLVSYIRELGKKTKAHGLPLL